MNKILIAWIGAKDLEASDHKKSTEIGPIGFALKNHKFTAVRLLSNYEPQKNSKYLSWLKNITTANIAINKVGLENPTDYEDIFKIACEHVSLVSKEFKEEQSAITYHLSPGTPAMSAVWIILAKTIKPAELIQTSKQRGFEVVYIPFELSAEYVPTVSPKMDKEIREMTAGLTAETADFQKIIYRCVEMKQLIVKARKIAEHDVPVIIIGETGTGKELFAKAIHNSSKRKNKKIVSINCSAIPKELFEAEIFGYTKGAFTGAIRDKAGILQIANDSTLFLDEVGDLSLDAQTKLLRAVQEGEARQVGATTTYKFDVRIIVATNKDLIKEVSKGAFRADLFHRLNTGFLKIPPLRERGGDIGPLIDHFLEDINNTFSKDSIWIRKKLSPKAKNVFLTHEWPGNVRELVSTLRRTAIWTPGDTIEEKHALENIVTIPKDDCSLLPTLGDGFDLRKIVDSIQKDYIIKALEKSDNNVSKASRLLGIENYQTLATKIKKLHINND